MAAHVEVHLNAAGHGEVLVDGKPVPGCYGLTINAHAGDRPTVALLLHAVVDADLAGATVTVGP